MEYNLEKARQEKDFGREESKVELDNNEDKDISDVKTIFSPKSIEKEKAKKILNKLTFKMNIINEGNGKTIEYKEIKYGNGDKMETMEEIDNLERRYNYDNIINDENIFYKERDLYENYKRLLLFLEQIEEYILSPKIKLFNSEVSFEIIESPKDSEKNKDNIYYLICLYTFNELKFIDRNILVNGIDSKTRGFIFLINELTNEDYKNKND